MEPNTRESMQLARRKAMPAALRVLTEQYPREVWESHSNFDGLTRFWLERHGLFRRLLAAMQNDSEAVLAKTLDPEQYAHRLARYGAMFVEQLHGHHRIEDMHYFPQLAGFDSRLERGFEILDKDHHALDGHLAEFSSAANKVLQARGDQALLESAKVHSDLLQTTERFLNRHLEDEEELIVPVILKYGVDGLV